MMAPCLVVVAEKWNDLSRNHMPIAQCPQIRSRWYTSTCRTARLRVLSVNTRPKTRALSKPENDLAGY